MMNDMTWEDIAKGFADEVERRKKNMSKEELARYELQESNIKAEVKRMGLQLIKQSSGPYKIIDEKAIESFKTDKGGITNKTLKSLGVPMPAKKGWKRRLIGKKIPMYKYLDIVKHRNVKVKYRK